VPALLAGGTMILEGHDPACAACHLPPEATYVARASRGQPADLAAAHAGPTPAVRCIDCHAGPRPRDRARGLELAARDGWSMLRGAYVVVGAEYAPLGASRRSWPEDACRACHAEVLDGDAFDVHFHNLLDDADAPPLSCTACHGGHRLRPRQPYFLTDADAAAACAACHEVMGGPSSPLRGAPVP
jgi:hypothetical protein